MCEVVGATGLISSPSSTPAHACLPQLFPNRFRPLCVLYKMLYPLGAGVNLDGKGWIG